MISLPILAAKWKSGKIIQRVIDRKLTYLERAALIELAAAVWKADRSSEDGILLEAGCALGGSAIVIASAKKQMTPFHVHDAFGMIPAPGVQDDQDVHDRYNTIREGKAHGIAGNPYYGYEADLLERVRENFRSTGFAPDQENVTFNKGLFAETINGSEPVKLAHLDGDWYESTMTCLERIIPRLVVNGTIIIDDYAAWSGCRHAVDEYFKGKTDEFDLRMKTRLHITRRLSAHGRSDRHFM
jgi:asparagine synthase (glutamine-hydrolysing)